jgi:1,4-alpha-glucan branching enzyme
MMWLYDFHMDGLRYDMTPYMRSVHGSGVDLPEGWDLRRWINTSIRDAYPGRITIAEDMHQDPKISQVDNHGAAFHAQWDGAFVHPVREAVIAREDAWRSLAALGDAITKKYNDDAFQRVIYTESHDEVANGQARVPSEIDEGDPTGYFAQKRSTAGAALVFTSPGIPMIFQGQEFLQGEWFRDDVPLDWDQRDDFRGIVRMFRDLINLRLNRSGTSKGLTGHHIEVTHANEDANVLVFHRWADGGPGDSVLVVVNLSNEVRGGYRIGLPAEGTWKLVFNSDASSYSTDFEGVDAYDVVTEPDDYDGQSASGVISIGAYTVLIFSYQG